jgi:vitamin-K-epoxide reductase (warfarin-sensitive)
MASSYASVIPVRTPAAALATPPAPSAKIETTSGFPIVPALMRYLLVFLSLAGLVVATLALRIHYSNATEPCSINEHWDCGIVNHSSYSEVAHIPVAAVGMAGYLVLAVLSFMRRRILLFSGAVVGFAFALHLSSIERDVLQVWCLYCVISQGIIALILLLSLAWMIAHEVSKRRATQAAT